MSYVLTHDSPGNAYIYAQVSAEIGEAMPDEFIAHVVHEVPTGLRHVEVWQSREAWERFQADRVGPAVSAVLARLGVEQGDSTAEESPEAYEVLDVRLRSTR